MTWTIGLTGGIACGKSEAARRIQHHGIPLLDTDEVARSVLCPGTPQFEAVVHRFGTGILKADGTLNRAALAERVFSQPSDREDLNRLVHPEIRRRWQAWLAARSEPVAVVVIPLLVETGSQEVFDDICCITSTEERMLERLAGRGLTPEQARQRIQSQMPLEEKKKVATWILENNASLAEFHRRVDAWIATLTPSETNHHVG